MWEIAARILLFTGLSGFLSAQTFTTLFNFDGTDGSRPLLGSLIQGPDGHLYGTTHGGGTGFGTIFDVTTDGVVTTHYRFHRTGGQYPTTGLILGRDGRFYGTTPTGQGVDRNGSIYALEPSGTFRFLHGFALMDGTEPEAPVLQASDANFYGTARTGGAHGYGTVFRITAGGIFTTLYSFTGNDDGANPAAGLTQGTDGDLYGSTSARGAGNGGTIFRVTLGGQLTTLYSFHGADGVQPYAALIQATDGNFYGTTVSGGLSGSGTVFKMTPGGALTTLYNFLNDGMFPFGTLLQAADGNFYGTAERGGSFGLGSVFRMDASGNFVALHSFGTSDGANPYGGLVQASDGNLYGMTSAGGSSGHGTIFQLSLEHTR